ncbi:hypothetical protein [Jiangella alkaliphila]|uniref:Uncharacterized protein n=1 Tax=Jiangella alkaliphila TaxID=419479 RepID=A0A1H2IX02_9ACTN|nr:hypothetical protein [Jiangella alkaliphila]SDU48680.1 hypothetical protein SAMN04488563_2093 [Jiangella alkaliphila]
MTDVPDAPAPADHRWPAWALPAATAGGVVLVLAGMGLSVARYRAEPFGLAVAVPLLVVTTLAGAGVVSRAMRHGQRRYAVTEIAVMLGVALLFYAGRTPGHLVLATMVGGGLLATARTIRRDRDRQATKMQNGWPERSA